MSAPSMLTASFHHLLWNDLDPVRRTAIHAAFERELAKPSVTRGILDQHNAWYEIMWAAQKPLGPDSDGYAPLTSKRADSLSHRDGSRLRRSDP